MKAKLKQHFKRKSIVNIILSIIVAVVMVARFLRADYYSVFLCMLTLLLFNIPVFVDKKLHVELPAELEAIILLFIFSAEILGEIGSFYTHIPWWDTMLHTINGFLMAAIGFALIDILNNSPKFHITMSPIFVAFVAFCFSMTVGVVWEFFEFFMDYFTLTDMQKDRMVADISSVLINPSGLNDEIVIKGIESTTVTLKDGSTHLIEGGYLDIGIIDTMKDLFVNLIGAVVFSTIGYFYIIGRNKGVFAKKFIPQFKSDDSNEKEIKE
ncbi:MAG: hypothetical protein IKB73_00450 [Ruminococcus sp.]|nr:hypothetical protein [Ruminococcus sp.]